MLLPSSPSYSNYLRFTAKAYLGPRVWGYVCSGLGLGCYDLGSRVISGIKFR